MLSLRDKTVFITGASAGIGRACAFAFASAGSDLLLAARRIEKLEELKSEILKDYKIKIELVKLDVRDYEQVKNKISSLDDKWKNADILLNNAGLARGLSKVHDGNIDMWNEMIDTNIKGLLHVTREILPYMVKRESGHVINIGSTAGHEVYLNGNVYSSTKFAVKALTQSIRLDVLDKKIRVSSVDPGMVETEFSLVRFSGDETKAKSVYKGLTPLSPEDVAEAVLFCATRPENVNINEIILTPLAQASSTQVIRNS